MTRSVDVAVIGGGIVGLATAWKLLEKAPALSVAVLEKEPAIALHQTSHNSGVLHTGVYYTPGSLRALNCRDGRASMVEFCERNGVPYEICGKVIVAVTEDEVPRLDRIYRRGIENGVACERIGPERLRELEPHAAGVAAIHVPGAGIVDFLAVAVALARRITEAGGEIVTDCRALRFREVGARLIIETTRGEFDCTAAAACGGLQSDRIARAAGADPGAKIVPFRGEYYALTAEAAGLCRNLIYPVPDPAFPFLGVHFTRMVGGGVECGPNAVLALAREGYRWGDVNVRDLVDSVSYPGFLRLAARHWRAGLAEVVRSVSKRAFVSALQRLVPQIRREHLRPAPAGVRAQALNGDGRLVDDFLIVESERMIHLCNAPSPAATASLEIGGHIAGKLANRFGVSLT